MSLASTPLSLLAIEEIIDSIVVDHSWHSTGFPELTLPPMSIIPIAKSDGFLNDSEGGSVGVQVIEGPTSISIRVNPHGGGEPYLTNLPFSMVNEDNIRAIARTALEFVRDDSQKFLGNSGLIIV